MAVRYGFRSPPHLELKARPKLGEREVTLVHVTDWIEKKLDQEFQVYNKKKWKLCMQMFSHKYNLFTWLIYITPSCLTSVGLNERLKVFLKDKEMFQGDFR